MKAGRFMVRMSRWMARSLHELAARFERWSGAASTPPPAAPPLPDSTMQALAERFPGAPEHWLRLVASRLGPSALSATVGTPRAAEGPRMPQASPAPTRFPRPAPARRWPIAFGFGRKPRGGRQETQAGPDFVPVETRELPGFDAAASAPASSNPAFPGFSDPDSNGGPGFEPAWRRQRFTPEFPSAERGPRSDALRFAAPATSTPRAPLALPRDATVHDQSPPAFAGPPALPATGSAFAPIGGEWRSGYEVRQPGELRNIWPELPPSDHSVPDAQPLHADEEAIRLEQMVARWSA